MAKEPISARVPQTVAQQVEAYAEAHDLSRTEAVTRLLQYAVNQSPPPEVGEEETDPEGDLNPVYTVRLFPDMAEYVTEAPKPAFAVIQDSVRAAAREEE
jgi:hypothetical protein